jgi:APA family basic amino acid/polyamine antiporter
MPWPKVSKRQVVEMWAKSPLPALQKKRLRLFDCLCLIVGMVIGAGVFGTSGEIAAQSGSFPVFVSLWIFGGLVALSGALCFAELSTAYPYDGGVYIYLERAFGRRVAFVYAWAEFWLIRPANIGIVAVTFAAYAKNWSVLGSVNPTMIAALAIIALAGLNGLGLREGIGTQNLLTVLKTLAIVLVIGCGIVAPVLPWAGSGEPSQIQDRATEVSWPIALLGVMFCYGGWNDMGAVAAEVENPRRNLVVALIGGVGLILLIYLGLQFSFVSALGFEGVSKSPAVAVDTMKRVLGPSSASVMNAIVCVSSLGALNALLLTGSRLFAVAGRQSGMMGDWLSRWDDSRGVPYASLITQTVLSVAMVLFVSWTSSGQPSGQLGRLLLVSAPWFWGFLALVGVAHPLLRRASDRAEGHFRTPLGLPFAAILVLSSLAMGGSAIMEMAAKWQTNRGWELPISVAIMLAGIAATWLLASDDRERTA